MKTYEDFLQTPVKVFVSYCWTSEEHKKWVLELASRLRQNGVDVVIDRWDLKEGQDKYQFMEQMVTDPNVSKVLIICDKGYKEKADSRKGGVGDESQIITAKLYRDTKQTKFIPIISETDDSGDPYLPAFISSRIYIDLSDLETYEEEYSKLLHTIFDRPYDVQPPLGLPPTHIFEEKSQLLTKTFSLSKKLKNAIIKGETVSVGLFEEYLDKLLSVLRDGFQIDPNETDEPFDEAVIMRINEFLPYRDEYIDLVNAICQYNPAFTHFATLIINYFEKSTDLFVPKSNTKKFDHYRFIFWELFLYTAAILIFRRKINEFNMLVEKQYLVSSGDYPELSCFEIFYQEIPSLDRDRKQRLGQKKRSLAVDELFNRTNKIVPFNLLLQSDLVLFLRSIKFCFWEPITMYYARSAKSDPLEFFIRAESKPEFEILLKFIDHKDKDDLKQTIAQRNLSQVFGMFFNLSHLTNFNNLGTR